MLNTDIQIQTNDNHQSINIYNPSTGQLTKISKTSRIARFQKGSKMETEFFCDEPYIEKSYNKYYEDSYGMTSHYTITDKYNIEIIQVIVFGNDQFLVEYEVGEKIN